MRNLKFSSLTIAITIPLAAMFILSGCARTAKKHGKKKVTHISRSASPAKKHHKRRVRKSDRMTTASILKRSVQKTKTAQKIQPKQQKLVMLKSLPHQAIPLTIASSGNSLRLYSAFKGPWNISVAGETCRLDLQMSGDQKSRAATTFECATPMLVNISSWTVHDKNLLLKSAGTLVATLYPTGPSRFDGETAYSQSISLTKP